MPAGTSVANALVAKIGADLTGFQSGLREAQGAAKKASRKVGRAFQAAGALITGYLTKKVIDAGRAMFDLGASVLETRSKFETVFGVATLEVEKFAERFGTIAGLSQSQTQAVLATTGSIVQGMGFAQQASADFAQQVVQLSGDLGSFNNIPTAEVAAAIQSALTGEREQLKRLGIVIRETDVQQRAMIETGKTSAKALTDQEKATATLALISERAGVAVGDLARTQDSAANRAKRIGAAFRDVKEQLSVAFLPIITDNVLPALEDLIAKIKENQETIVRLGTAFVEVGKVIVTTVKEAFQIVGGILGNIGAIIVGIFTADFQLVKTAVIDLKDVVVDNVEDMFAAWQGLAENLPRAMEAAAARARGQTEGEMERALRLLQDLKPAVREIPRELALNLPGLLPKIEENIVFPLERAKGVGGELGDTVADVGNTITSQVSSGIADVVLGFKNAGEAAKQLGETIVKEVVGAIAAAIAKMVILKAIQGATGIPIFEKGGMIPTAQHGLMLPSASATGGIPIIAHPGEAVLSRDAVRMIGGPPAVTSLNRGTETQAVSRPIRLLNVVNLIDPVSGRKREIYREMKDLARLDTNDRLPGGY